MTDPLRYRSLVIIGAGGHGRAVAALARRTGHAITGFLDRDKRVMVDGVPVLGNDEALSSMAPSTFDVAIGLGSRKVWEHRRRLCRRLEHEGFGLPSLVDPDATVIPSVELGVGAQVFMGARVQHGSRIGAWTIVNSGAIVEHDCRVESHVHIAPGAVLCGGVTVGEGVFMGAGSVVREGVTIGIGATVAAGAVVVRDVAERALVMGVPARVTNDR